LLANWSRRCLLNILGGNENTVSMDNSHYEQPSMSEWSGRVDSDDDYDAFRWHQWVAPLDLLNSPGEIPGRLKFAFWGLCCDEGIRRNQGRPGASKGPMVIRRPWPIFLAGLQKKYDCTMQGIFPAKTGIWKKARQPWLRR
jgi:hypothetical protein